LAGVGLTVEQIKQIENDLKTYTLEQVLKDPVNPAEGRFTEQQKEIVRKLITTPGTKSTSGTDINIDSF